MDREPLLKKSSRYLFKLDDDAAAAAQGLPITMPMSPSDFKEKLVYGTFESPRSYYLPRLFSNEGQFDTEEFLAESERRRGCNFRSVEPINHPVVVVPTTASTLVSSGVSSGTAQGCVSDAESYSDSSFSSSSCLDKYDVAVAPAQEAAAMSGGLFRQLSRKKTLKKSRTAPAFNVRFSKSNSMRNMKRVKRPKLETAMSVVMQASFGLLVYLVIGMVIYQWRRDDFSGESTVPLVDGLYFCIVTMCTIGYGDITPLSPQTKLFACLFVLVGFGFIDILLSGMVAYVLERQEHLLLSAVEGSHHETAKNYLVNTEKGRMRIRTKVGLAMAVVVFCVALGTLVMHWTEQLSWVDSFYLSCMSVTTVGYGDHTFKTASGRLFAAGWLLVSTLAVARSFLFLAEARIDRRNRLIAKWVLHREMTIGDLVAADIDNNGFVSKSEYVIYKLKEMNRVSEKDIMEVCRQFSVLDRDNSGRITISCLMASGDFSNG